MLNKIRADLHAGRGIEEAVAAFEARIDRSESIYGDRKASIPELIYPKELPVAEKRQEILDALMAHQVIVICGETGSGKTTQIPKICLEAGRGVSGLIGHTQPRRIAARSVATRIAEELRQSIGQAVGYKVRFQDQTHANTLVKLMTDGILLAETQHDRFLSQYDTLIVDEAHERSLNIDFLLGYLSWLLPRRPDLKLIITSATIDPERFSRHFGHAPIIHVSGRTFPVDVRYRPVEVEEGDETDGAEQQAILAAVDELWREVPGDILIFLSGEREIRETAETLRKHHPSKCEILPLYSRLSQSEQDRVFRPESQRRIILATNVAETSLTVPGIRSVIDSGFARISRYSHRSKLQRLPIERISRASANQRSGRCGRLGPGIAIRLYSEEDFLSRSEFTEPEILRTNLAAVILQMHALNLGEISRFPFVEPPDERLIRDGIRTLQEVNAFKEAPLSSGKGGALVLTKIGQRLAKLPVDPRLGRILLAAAEEHCLNEVSVIVAALSVPDPRERPQDRSAQADQRHARFKDELSDFASFLKLWDDYQTQKKHLSRAKLRQYCRDSFLSYVRMMEWQEVHSQLLDVLKGELELTLNSSPGDYVAIHRSLLTGLLSNVSLRQDLGEYAGARGVKLFIHPGSFLFKLKPKWILAAEQVETTKVYARTVAKIEPEWIEAVGAHMVKQHHFDPHWERKSARVMVHERTTLFGLTVQTGRKVPYEKIDPKEARALFIRHALVHMDYESRAPFFLHNLKVLEEADYLQQKGRRVDLLVDEDWLFQFFAERIPSEVLGGPSFETWRKKAEVQTPDLLKLQASDITVREDESLHDQNFPDSFQAGPLRFKLEYRFEPNHEDDGISVLIPLHLLNQLYAEPFQWLVPGLLDEKLAALIKSLPKTLRIHFVPVPNVVEKVRPMLDFGEGSVYRQLSLALKKVGGIQVSTEAFRDDVVPAHLKMNYLLVDENNVVLDRSRDLEELKSRHFEDAGRNFTELAGQVYLHKGCHEWTFGELDICFDGQFQGQSIYGFPAVVDEGDSVGVRIFSTPYESAQQHARGLSKLFRLVLSKELKYLKKSFASDPLVELVYSNLAVHPHFYSDLAKRESLKEDLAQRAFDAVFMEDQPDIRDPERFNARISACRQHLLDKAEAIAKTVQSILRHYSDIQPALKVCRNSPIKQDIEQQLGMMIYSGFLLSTPYTRLLEFPRYLKAILHRLEKAAQDPLRDLKQFKELEGFKQRYLQALLREQGRFLPEADPFRWMLEEFRVSLFAQQLKTAFPVSVKRLEEAWQQRSSLKD